jgi:protein involved in polysaccharide export with SLBB domain
VLAQDGEIRFPCPGGVLAAGHTPLQVEHTIEDRLAEEAIEPHVIVTVAMKREPSGPVGVGSTGGTKEQITVVAIQ